jgi:hypothetical protein
VLGLLLGLLHIALIENILLVLLVLLRKQLVTVLPLVLVPQKLVLLVPWELVLVPGALVLLGQEPVLVLRELVLLGPELVLLGRELVLLGCLRAVSQGAGQVHRGRSRAARMAAAAAPTPSVGLLDASLPLPGPTGMQQCAASRGLSAGQPAPPALRGGEVEEGGVGKACSRKRRLSF